MNYICIECGNIFEEGEEQSFVSRMERKLNVVLVVMELMKKQNRVRFVANLYAPNMTNIVTSAKKMLKQDFQNLLKIILQKKKGNS